MRSSNTKLNYSRLVDHRLYLLSLLKIDTYRYLKYLFTIKAREYRRGGCISVLHASTRFYAEGCGSSFYVSKLHLVQSTASCFVNELI